MIKRVNDLLLLLTYFDDEIAGHGDWGHAVWRISIDQLRLSFIERIEPDAFLDELTFIIPGDKCNFTKSRYVYRLLADIDRLEGEMKVEKQDAYYRSEEHTSELQSLMRISYAVFCLKKKDIYITQINITTNNIQHTNKK